MEPVPSALSSIQPGTCTAILTKAASAMAVTAVASFSRSIKAARSRWCTISTVRQVPALPLNAVLGRRMAPTQTHRDAFVGRSGALLVQLPYLSGLGHCGSDAVARASLARSHRFELRGCFAGGGPSKDFGKSPNDFGNARAVRLRRPGSTVRRVFTIPLKCPPPPAKNTPESAPQPMLAASKRASLSRGGWGVTDANGHAAPLPLLPPLLPFDMGRWYSCNLGNLPIR
jgi:hypothetical protein